MISSAAAEKAIGTSMPNEGAGGKKNQTRFLVYSAAALVIEKMGPKFDRSRFWLAIMI
jgi:hypothetical protein